MIDNFLSQFGRALQVVVILFSMAHGAYAQTIVNVTTPLGDFSIELFESEAPATVANFLNYVNSGRYNGTIIHRTEPRFVVQGGGFTFNQATSNFSPIATDPAVINEFSIPNTRGTLAMAKFSGDPNSATSQWFVNLADNRANLDNQNGGFTVFGQVIGDGMIIVDAIAALPRFDLGIGGGPLIGFSGGTLIAANLVTLTMSVQPPEPDPVFSNTFDATTNEMSLKIALDDGQFVELGFSLIETVPDVLFQTSVARLTELSSGDETFASFDSVSGQIIVPELYVGTSVALRNLVFNLRDSEQLIFHLVSFDP